MSISDSTIKGKFNEAVGSVKQGFGEAVGNDRIANEGAAEQVKGHAQQAWGSVKEGAADLKADHDAHAAADKHDARESVTSAAENAKAHVQSGVDHLLGRKAS